MTGSSRSGFEHVDVNHDASDRVEITVDTSVFSEDVVFKACYAFTDRCHVQVERRSLQTLGLLFKPRNVTELTWLIGEFRNELISQRVRERISVETKAIRELIVAQAFAEADFLDNPPASR